MLVEKNIQNNDLPLGQFPNPPKNTHTHKQISSVIIRDGFKKKKKLMEFSIKGPDPASQPLNKKKKNMV